MACDKPHRAAETEVVDQCCHFKIFFFLIQNDEEKQNLIPVLNPAQVDLRLCDVVT